MMILTIAVAAVMVPALIYTAMHPQTVTSTVKQIAIHMPTHVKDFHVAVVASRTTPTPAPTATPAPSPTPNPKASKAAKTELAHLAHLKHAHALALAALRAKRLALTGQISDSAGSSGLESTVSTSGSESGSQTTGAGNSATTDNASNSQPVTSTTATPATIAAAPQQQPQADATPVYQPDVVVDARFKQRVEPDYPDVAKEQNAQGTAVVFATIGPTGRVISVHIDQSTGNKLLDSAALAAARESSFEPPEVNGKPATETYRLVYTFALSG